MMYTVELEQTEVGTAVQYRAPVQVRRLGDDIGQRMEELYAVVAKAGLAPSGPPSISYLEHPRPDAQMQIELDAPVTPPAGPTGEKLAGTGALLVTTGGELVAHTRHHGPYTSLGKAHAALDRWLAERGHRPRGAHRETYLVGPAQVTDPNEYVTDVSVPVATAL